MAPGAGMLLGGQDTLSAKVTFKCQLSETDETE